MYIRSRDEDFLRQVQLVVGSLEKISPDACLTPNPQATRDTFERRSPNPGRLLPPELVLPATKFGRETAAQYIVGGKSSVKFGEQLDAIRLFSKALELEPTNNEALSWRGTVRRLQRDPKCREDLELAVRNADMTGRSGQLARLNLCALWLTEGRQDDMGRANSFLSAYRSTIESHDVFARLLYGVQAALQGETYLARLTFQTLQNNKVRNIEAPSCALALMALQKNARAEAKELAEEILDKNPNNPIARYVLAKLSNSETQQAQLLAEFPHCNSLRGVLLLPLPVLSPELFRDV